MRPEVQVLPGPPVSRHRRAARCIVPTNVRGGSRVLKKLALAAAVAGLLAAVRKRTGSAAEADLWHEATRGPGAISTPSKP
jgi:hypothetical protein